MNYVILDIHGCYYEFLSLLKEISFSESDHLYILGDAVDRGSEPMKVLLEIMERSNITFILGNHDFLFYTLIDHIK